MVIGAIGHLGRVVLDGFADLWSAPGHLITRGPDRLADTRGGARRDLASGLRRLVPNGPGDLRSSIGDGLADGRGLVGDAGHQIPDPVCWSFRLVLSHVGRVRHTRTQPHPWTETDVTRQRCCRVSLRSAPDDHGLFGYRRPR